MNKRESMLAYHKYIQEHRKNVQIAWEQLYPISWKFRWGHLSSTVEILSNVMCHDLSKYSEKEFEGYRQKFYPTDEETPDDDLWQKAWEHHKNNNPHHWQTWTTMSLLDEKKDIYFVEMLCDWMSMTMKFGGSTREWYEKQTEIKLPKMYVDMLYQIFDLLEGEKI